jgi:hypothetical protein
MACREELGLLEQGTHREGDKRTFNHMVFPEQSLGNRLNWHRMSLRHKNDMVSILGQPQFQRPYTPSLQFVPVCTNQQFAAETTFRELVTIRFHLQKDVSETIGFKVPNLHWFEWCILLDLTI